MRSRVVLSIAFALTAAACAGGSSTSTSTTSPPTTAPSTTTTAAATTTTTTEPGFTVTSEDGNLTLWVPESAMAEDPGITISVLAPEDYPPELAGAAATPGASIYAAEPDGLEFAAPVTVTRRVNAADFDLAPNEVPVIVLLTRSAAGVYEPYGDLEVRRNGPDIYVSGTITHFSPIIAERESTTASFDLAKDQLNSLPSARRIDDYLKLNAEAGGTIGVTVEYRDNGGEALMPPAVSGWLSIDGDGIDPNLGSSTATISSDAIGAIDIQMSYTVTFTSDPAVGTAGVSTLKKLAPGRSSIDMTFTLSGRMQFYDPKTSILGLSLADFEIASDHPGGKEWVPDGDFLGGLSAAYSWMGYSDRFAGLYGGLIYDANGNGMVDSNDAMYSPHAYGTSAGMFGYVSPLYMYADYFAYLVDGTQYSGMPTGWDGGIDLGDALAAYADKYNGEGRFESSIGVVGKADGNPFVYTVDASEEPQQVPDATIFMVPGLRIQF